APSINFARATPVFRGKRTYKSDMDMFDSFRKSIGLPMAGKKNPWGGGSGGENPPGDGQPPASEGEGNSGPRNPWLPGGGDDDKRRSANIEDIFKHRGPEGPRRRGGGPRGPRLSLPERPGGKSWLPLIAGGVVAVWLFTTGVHFVQPREQGIVTWLGGKYSSTLNPGTNFSLPWPIQQVEVENVSEIRSEKIPDGNQEKLILTGDQNLVDLSYLIRWNIKDLKQFKFNLQEPEETVREAAEAAMRASVAEQELDTVLSGEGRADIEQSVRNRMQAILDAYRAGIAVQGIEIDKTDPPQQVIEAFNDVLAAQQDAERDINQARRYAQQLLARAEGDAAAFNQIYAEYRLAPEVTRRRLYYETMESVLSKTDKTIIEADGVTPYLPLPEVQRRARDAQKRAGEQ
ncbi:MAG TPA: FtsH protease activity modulator HflK, partial [Erythrobacter sp.]|nr:FtsH protease activity modulator HflK [Erythrobacter sp.]